MGLGKVDTGDGEQLQQCVPAKDVTVALFFDGTKNNMYNTDARNHNNKAYQEHKEDDSSYENDYSNVAQLWKNFREDQGNYIFGHYIEGIGTEKLKADSLIGYAAGSGDTGIPAKVAKACKWITNALNMVAPLPPNIIENLIIDVFGFSRGAGAARCFVNEVSKAEYKSGLPVEVGNIIIRFVGLFDCVISYIGWGDLELGTMALARRVIHLTAADEHRVHFPLTTIDSVGLERGFTYILPGVHSDIGGGYCDNRLEKHDIIFRGSQEEVDAEWKRIVQQKWYKDSELFSPDNGFKTTINEFARFVSKSEPLNMEIGGARTLRNTYSFIPLHFMCKHAVEFTNCFFKGKPINFNLQKIEGDAATSIDSDETLPAIKARLEKHVFENAEPLSFTTEKLEGSAGQDNGKLGKLRNNYLHWSAYYDFKDVMRPRIINHQRLREVIQG